jgi:hypothetical protein
VDGKILRVVPLFPTIFCHSQGGRLRDLPVTGNISQLFGYFWQVLRLQKCRWQSYPLSDPVTVTLELGHRPVAPPENQGG